MACVPVNMHLNLRSMLLLPALLRPCVRKPAVLVRKLLVIATFITALLMGCSNKAYAQAASFVEVDVGTPTPGSFSYNGGVTPPTWTVTGSGSGPYTNSDAYAYAFTQTSGDIELYGQVTSFSSSNSAATAGIAIRSNDITQADKVQMSVTKSGTVQFIYAISSAFSGNIINGPTVSLPVYLKVAKTGDTITGSYSSDGQSWTVLSSFNTPTIMPKKYSAGLFTASSDASLNTSVFKNIVYATSVPKPSSNMLLWLRADKDVTASSGAVSAWADQSGSGNNATQSTAANKPTLNNGVLNSGVLPSISFNGSSSFLSCPSGFSGFDSGYYAFIVCKPTNLTSTGTLCSMGNTSNSDALFPQIINANAKLNVFNGTTGTSVATTTSPITSSSYQLLEETLVPGATTSTGTIYVNGSQIVQSTSLAKPNNVSRTSNLIGAGVGPASFFNGGIAEVLIFNSCTPSQKAMVESYILSKYGVGTAPTLDVPVISPSPGLFLPPQNLTLSQGQNAVVYFTEDGSTPNSATSQWFNYYPIVLNKTTTIKALAAKPFFNNSSVITQTYAVDPASTAVPRSDLYLWLRADQYVSTSGTNVTSWGDLSTLLNNATQSVSTKQPLFVANAVNGYPAINFTGSKTLQLPSGLANFTSGASLFVVLKPATVTAGARVLDFGNGATSDNLQLQLTSSTGAGLYVYNGVTGTNVTSSSAIALAKFGLLEAIHNGSGSASIYTNGVLGNSGSLNNITNITRTSNFIGGSTTGTNFLNGQIAELILLNRAVTTAERTAIEGYLLNRYQLLSVNSPAAPKFNLSTSTLSAPTQIAMETPAGSQIYFTTDGTTPTSASTLYTGPIDVYFTQTLKAIAIAGGVSSAVTSATYTLDATHYPAPGTTSTPLQLDLQLPNPSIPQDNNQR